MQIAILGPLEVRGDGGELVDVAGARVRTLLARLALDAGRPVRVNELVDTVWADDPPAEATNALQTLVSRLRRTLGGTSTVAQSPSGYRLGVEPEDVDANRFRTLAGEAAADLRRGAPGPAAAALDEALALWRGAALADCRERSDTLQAAGRELDDLRLSAVVDRIEARLGVGGNVDLAELEHLAADHPLHERLAALHLRSLVAEGRQADALKGYETLRARLADELGVDPSAELQQLHLELVRGAPTRTRRTNLKAQLTSFVGREDEVARIGKALEQNRLVTLVGPGGAGKTRLAAEAGTAIADDVPDGVWMAELASVTDGTDVPQVIFGSLGRRELHLMDDRRSQLSARDATARLRDALVDQSLVLVLDNCEHVIEMTAQLADHLLSECPNLRILATSREPLGIVGEALLSVPPLGQPTPEARASEANEFPAVRLFADRAAAAVPDFQVMDENVGPVVEIVRRLDGLPLAIELAAARLRTVPVDEVARRLSDRFRLLTGGSRTALPRHRTLRAVVEWSWELLTDDERRLAEALSVFPAGITVGSATAVRPNALSADDVDDVLTALLDKSLLQALDGGRRMRMLETIREFCIERLGERAELGAAREKHARHFAELLFEAEPYLTTRDQLPWFEQLTTERENIVAAMRYYCDVEDADLALRIAMSLGGYAMMLGDHADIASWTSAALAVPGGTNDHVRLLTRALLAVNSTAAADPHELNDSMAEMRSVVGELDRAEVPPDNPLVMLMRPVMAFMAGESELAEKWTNEALSSDDGWVRAASRMFRASFAENSGEVEPARRDTELALAEFEALGERWGLASALRNIAQLRTLDGDLDGATTAYEQSLELVHELKSHDDEIFVHARLADLALRRGDEQAAREHLVVPRSRIEAERSPFDALFALAMVGDMEFRLGDEATGRRLVAESLARLEAMPREVPVMGHIRALVCATAARQALADGNLDRAGELAVAAHAAAAGTKDLPIIAMIGVGLSALVRAQGDAGASARLLGAAANLRGADDETDLDVRAQRAALGDELGTEEFERRYAEGRALPKSEALALFESVQARLR